MQGSTIVVLRLPLYVQTPIVLVLLLCPPHAFRSLCFCTLCSSTIRIICFESLLKRAHHTLYLGANIFTPNLIFHD